MKGLTREELLRRLELLKQNTDHIVEELIKRGFKTIDDEELGTIINSDSEPEIGYAITNLYILADSDTDYPELYWTTEKEHEEGKNPLGIIPHKGEEVTGEDILNWHGSDHGIDELAETLAEILNGEYSIQDAREDILDYREDFGDE